MNSKRLYYQKGDSFYFRFPYNKEILIAIKSFPKRQYNSVNDYWIVDTNFINKKRATEIVTTYGFIENDFSMEDGKETHSYCNDEIEQTLIKYSKRIPKLGLQTSPRPYQEVAVNFLLTKENAILGDDMGVGKTPSTVFSVERGRLFPFLVICPSSVKYHWESFWKMTNPDRDICVIESSGKENNWNADVVIINYDILGYKEKNERTGKCSFKLKYPELISTGFVGVVMDEIHYIKNGKSIRSKMCRKIAKKCKYKWGLSGTLAVNRPNELINPLNTIGVFKGLFGTWDYFVRRYCDLKVTPFGQDYSGSSNLIELNQKLRHHCYLRREKTEVLKDLPKVQTTVIETSLSNRKTYDNAENNFIDYIRKNFEHDRVERAKVAEELVLRNELVQLCIKGKMKFIQDWINDFLEGSTEKLLVFGIHRDPLIKLSEKFNSPLIIGGSKPGNLQKIVNNFKTSKDRLLFGNIQSMGTGTDGLQHACCNALFIELPYTPAEEDQAISRVVRSGQSKRVNIYYLLAKNSIDLKLRNALDLKSKYTNAMNKGEKVDTLGSESFRTILSKEFLKE